MEVLKVGNSHQFSYVIAAVTKLTKKVTRATLRHTPVKCSPSPSEKLEAEGRFSLSGYWSKSNLFSFFIKQCEGIKNAKLLESTGKFNSVLVNSCPDLMQLKCCRVRLFLQLLGSSVSLLSPHFLLFHLAIAM